jgi:hypothetical protein
MAMKKFVSHLLVVAAFAGYATLAEAQAVARGGGGGGSSSSSGSSSGSSSSGGGGSTSSASSPSGGSTYSPPSAPSHSAAPPRTPSHSGGYTGGGSRGGDGSSYSGAGSRGTAGIRHPENGSTTTATAPTYARPDGRPVVGYAVPRTNYRPPISGGSAPIIFYPWGYGFGLGAYGYGYGLSYFCDPFYGSCGYPYGYGYGYPGYYGYGGYPGYGGYYGAGGYDYSGGDYSSSNWSPETQDALSGQLRIKVKPREARVLVDGNFMGTVDDFDGRFQHLTLPEGRHQVTLQLEGYEPLTFNVMVIAGETVNYEGEMHKLGAAPKR